MTKWAVACLVVSGAWLLGHWWGGETLGRVMSVSGVVWAIVAWVRTKEPPSYNATQDHQRTLEVWEGHVTAGWCAAVVGWALVFIY